VLFDPCSAVQLNEVDGLRGGFGVSNSASGAPTTADTVVCIASMTKTVTSACAMPLAEQARLSLDEPIASVLPELGNVQVLEASRRTGAPSTAGKAANQTGSTAHPHVRGCLRYFEPGDGSLVGDDQHPRH
jgi:CubicO group peptidase (beta-lactamase class C family)